MWLHQPFVKKGLSRKLARPWYGPHTIGKKLSDVVFRVQKDGRGRKRTVVHFNRPKPCLLNEEENDSSAGPKTTLETLKKNVKKTQRNPDRSEQSTDDEDDADIPPERNRHRHKKLIRTRNDPELNQSTYQSHLQEHHRKRLKMNYRTPEQSKSTFQKDLIWQLMKKSIIQKNRIMFKLDTSNEATSRKENPSVDEGLWKSLRFD